nr:transposase [Photobacterium sp. TY1-4]
MKKSRYTDSQILAILKQAEAGTPVPELCREHGMSSATFYKWRAKYGGMDRVRLRMFNFRTAVISLGLVE